MPTMRAIDAAIAILEKEGTDTIFGLPGAAINPFYSAMRDHGGFKHILARHVEGASHMAEGYTRARAGNIGVSICYDRHFPEYMRALALNGADLVIVPQAGAVDEWPEGLYEAEMRVSAFHNGYFTALCNRVGKEDCLDFAGESFVCGPDGEVIARGAKSKDEIVFAEIDYAKLAESNARRLFMKHRRPGLYADWLGK
jgi:predicted amidohydrolase